MVTRLHDKQNHPSLHKTETAQTDVVLSALETIKQLHTKKTRVSGRHKCIIPARTPIHVFQGNFSENISMFPGPDLRPLAAVYVQRRNTNGVTMICTHPKQFNNLQMCRKVMNKFRKKSSFKTPDRTHTHTRTQSLPTLTTNSARN